MSLHVLETRAYTYGALDYASWHTVTIPFREILFIMQNNRDIRDTSHVASKNGTKISTCDVMLKGREEPIVIQMSFQEAAGALENYLFRQSKKE